MPISKAQLAKLKEIQLIDSCQLYLLRIAREMQTHNYFTQEKIDRRRLHGMYAARSLLYLIETETQFGTVGPLEIIKHADFESLLVLFLAGKDKESISIASFEFPFLNKSGIDALIHLNVDGFLKFEEQFSTYVHATLANERSQELLSKSRLVHEAVLQDKNITYVDFGDAHEGSDYPVCILCTEKHETRVAKNAATKPSKAQLEKLRLLQFHDACYWFDLYIAKVPNVTVATFNHDHKRRTRFAIFAARKLLYLIATETQGGSLGPVEIFKHKNVPIVLNVENVSKDKITIKARAFPYLSATAINHLLTANLEGFVNHFDSYRKDVLASLGDAGAKKLVNTSRLVREAIMKHSKHSKLVNVELKDGFSSIQIPKI